jgi:predicted ATP-dependent endonuclease of OLD family
VNPFTPTPYRVDKDWPRAHRNQKNKEHKIAELVFELDSQEQIALKEILSSTNLPKKVQVFSSYESSRSLSFDIPALPKVHPGRVASILGNVTRSCPDNCSARFRTEWAHVYDALFEAISSKREEFAQFYDGLINALEGTIISGLATTSTEESLVQEFRSQMTNIVSDIQNTNTMETDAYDYVIERLPVFIYMDEYKAFSGSAYLSEVKARMEKETSTPEDKTLLMLLELSGLNLNEEVAKSQQVDRTDRTYDLKDASRSLTSLLYDRWKQSKYEVEFSADGDQFSTFVRDHSSDALIKLEERSKGFQWFFSFDLLFMHETKGTFKNCVILLDEPGLHLHPEAQRDLLARLEDYATGNAMIYSTHLPFMIDLKHPERIRIVDLDPQRGTRVTENMVGTNPEAKLVLRAALGISGSTSYLLSENNLVVEGVDDYWLITEFSNLLKRSGKTGLNDNIMITPAGGASEAAYITMLMVGQELSVAVLLDSDKAGDDAADKLIKTWLTKYNTAKVQVFRLGKAAGIGEAEKAIEDLFEESFYLERVNRVYGADLKDNLTLVGTGLLVNRVARACSEKNVNFNKGSVAKYLRNDLQKMKTISELPEFTVKAVVQLIEQINKFLC